MTLRKGTVLHPAGHYLGAVWTLAIYLGLVIILAMSMIGVSFFLGEHHRERATAEPYESGITPTSSAHIRFPVQFYLIALFFLVFDIEAAFIFAWAVAARELGWSGYWGVFIFIAVLFCLLIYEWKAGALDWGPKRRELVAGATRGNR